MKKAELLELVLETGHELELLKVEIAELKAKVKHKDIKAQIKFTKEEMKEAEGIIKEHESTNAQSRAEKIRSGFTDLRYPHTKKEGWLRRPLNNQPEKEVSKLGRSHPEYHNAIHRLLRCLYELQTFVEGDISCRIYEQISGNENHNRMTFGQLAHGIHQCNNHEAPEGTQCSDFCINNQKGQYRVLLRSQTYSNRKNHQKLSDRF